MLQKRKTSESFRGIAAGVHLMAVKAEENLLAVLETAGIQSPLTLLPFTPSAGLQQSRVVSA